MNVVSFRHARTFLAASRNTSLTAAAAKLNRSQTCVTKALQELERQVGVELFDRSSRGVTLTVYGRAFSSGASQAETTLAAAKSLFASETIESAPSLQRFFAMDISERWLETLLALAANEDVPAAALELGITCSSVNATLKKLEGDVRVRLFDRCPGSITPTLIGRQLVKTVKLARRHLKYATEEVRSLVGEECGNVVVGNLPFVRTHILPRAITGLRRDRPYIDIKTREGRYDELVSDLRCGDIDFLVGALRGERLGAGLQEEQLLDDSLALIVRQGHPLMSKKVLEWEDILRYEWILPPRSTPARELFEGSLQKRGFRCPAPVVESSSTIILRGLLLQSNQISVLSPHQILYEEQSQLLTSLPFALEGARRPIGITLRERGMLSLAARHLIAALKTACQSSLQSDISERRSPRTACL